MYNVSSQFHTAVMSPSSPEKIKLTFADGTVLQNDYVVGFDYDEAVCEETDLTIGSVCGSQLTVDIFKDETEFQGFDFSGQYFEAELGVKIGNSYEYCPLGTFRAEKPETARVTSLTLTAYDKMTLFDVPLDGFIDTVTFPKTAKQLFTALCAYVGVTASTADFINSGKIFTELPWPAESTCREFLSMIAELACSFARMSRDDVCELVWFTPTSIELTKDKYTSRRNAEYAVKSIDKLQVKILENDVGCIVGSGTNAYIIQDNPLLYGASDAEIRQYAQPIYNRLNAWNPIIPAEVNARCDWSLQAGDIIKVGSYKQYGVITADGKALVTSDGENLCVQGIDEYDGMIDVPIFAQHIHWNGGATTQYISTGSQHRPVLSKSNRVEYESKRAYHAVENTVEAFRSEIYNSDGSSKIEQLADSISLVVDDNGDVNAASIVMAINESDSSIRQ